MELSSYEKKAIQEYISAISQHRSPKDVIRDCRTSLVNLAQNICLTEFDLSENSDDFKSPLSYIIRKGFFTYKDTKSDKYKPRNQLLGKIYRQFEIVKGNRTEEEYRPDVPATDDDAIQCKAGLKQIFFWYLNTYKRISLNSITNLSNNEKNIVAHLFTTTITRIERIIERENFYIILLIDSSQSMVWPYLKDPSNSNDEESTDYKNAFIQVQNAMQFAHEKSLNALRGSSFCNDGYLMIYQYTFNHKLKLLNDPEELYSLNTNVADKVVKINTSNYKPEGMTALYDVIDKSLKEVYNNYVKKNMNERGRIDKIIIGVITDGEDTIIEGVERFKSPSDYELKKVEKLKSIENTIRYLRGDGDPKKTFLINSVLIGLTGAEFTENRLKEIKKELNFDECISINQADEQSIRRAFKLFSTNAINV